MISLIVYNNINVNMVGKQFYPGLIMSYILIKLFKT